MTTAVLKEEVNKLVNILPENATWDDLIREIKIRQAIEKGIADSDAGRTVPVSEVRRQFGLSV